MRPLKHDLGYLKVLAATAAAAVFMLVVSLPLVAGHIDRRERDFEVRLVEKALANQRSGLSDRQGTTANWAELLKHTDWKIDPLWINEMFGDATGHDNGSRIIAILGADNSVLFASSHRRSLSATEREALSVATADLVRSLRAGEAVRARRPAHPPPVVPSDWVMRQSDGVMSGELHHFLANVIGSDSPKVRLHHAHAPILLYAASYPADVVPNLREQLELPNLAALTRLSPAKAGQLVLRGADNQAVGRLVWTPKRPGRQLIDAAVIPLTLSVCGLGAVLVFALYRSLASVKALNASEARANHLAFHDQLTELVNRRRITEQLAQALSRAQRHGGTLAVLLIDLDRFKFVNDTYGHQAGDILLKTVAERLKASCRAGDTCARLGGDEFVILADHCTASEAADIAQRVLTNLAQPVNLPRTTLSTAGSVGIATYAEGGLADVDDILRQADLALYRVKAQGRGSFCFFETEMDLALQHRRRLEVDLRAALAAGELKIVYQPQFRDGVLETVEALARWTHPERGAIGPGVFVTLAEECGLIVDLGLYVMRRAFEDSRRWPHLRVAINLSPAQLRARDFLPTLQLLIETSGINPESFELELTESVLLDDGVETQHTLAALRGLGFRLALDDFGTGYSSLSYLSRFPIDKIKIDQSFIQGIEHDKTSQAVVRAIIRLGRALSLEVVAEGVETQQQQQRLATMGCRHIQGYLLGRPVDAGFIEGVAYI